MKRSLDAWLDYIGTEHPSNVLGGLERVAGVAERAGVNPPAPRNVVVAGTNGKGSTCVFLEQLLLARGRRVGTTLSPHVHRFNERIRIDGREVGDAEIVAAFEAIEAARGDTRLTYFEFAVLAALKVFSEHEVEVSVLEVGLGGRLDAVNLVDADVAVITSIGIDHVEYLGYDRESIAAEKAGIMRSGVPVVFGERDVPKAIAARAAALGAPLYRAGEAFGEVDGAAWTVRYRRRDGGAETVASARPPSVAGSNAATAIQACALLEEKPDADCVALACAGAVVPGRCESIAANGRTWVVDVAHNPAGAAFLRRQLDGRISRGARLHAILGVLADKEAAGVAAALDDLVSSWTFTDTLGARGMSAADLAEKAGVEGVLEPDLAAAIERLGSTSRPNDVILVFGSFDVVERARNLLVDT